MANIPIVAPISLYVDRVKVGECTGGSFKVDNGVERIPTSDSIAFTLGKTVSEVSWKTVVPRAGMRARIMEAVISKKDVKIQFVADSKAYDIDGKIKSGSMDWEVASGNLNGDWQFLGGEPSVV